MFEDDLKSYFSFLTAILNKLNVDLNTELWIKTQLFLSTLGIYKLKSKVKQVIYFE